MENITCPLCRESSTARWQTLHSGAHIIRCHSCDLYFRDERTLLPFEEEYLTKGFHFDLDLQQYDNTHAPIFSEYLARLKPGSLLDIGCARGTLLRVAEINGFRPLFGTEPSMCDRNKLTGKYPHWKVFGSILNAEIPDEFLDNITAIDVLEHISNLREELSVISRKLKPGGRLLVVTGNIDSTCAQTQRASWEYFYTPGHINFFSPKTIHATLSALGFSKIQIQCSLDGIKHSMTAPITADMFAQRFNDQPPSSFNQSSSYLNEFDSAQAMPNHMKLKGKLVVHALLKTVCPSMYFRGNGMLIVGTK